MTLYLQLTRDVQASDVFAVNTGFTNPRKRVAVRLISSKSAVSQQRAKEAAQSAEEVNLQRRKVYVTVYDCTQQIHVARHTQALYVVHACIGCVFPPVYGGWRLRCPATDDCIYGCI